MEKLNVGIIGLGSRGQWLMRDVILLMPTVKVTAVCDVYEDRNEQAAALTEEICGHRPAMETDYKKLIHRDDVDVVVVTCAWESHVPAAIEAMKAGKPVGMEVGGAYSIKQCWDLVDTYEATHTPFMFLENCCYGRRELMALNMVKQGLFGDIVHCRGGYMHDLREEVAKGEENRHYRLRNYTHRNAENYPTHELGPIAKILGINHGNRMLSLTAMSSRSAGLHEYVKDCMSDNDKLLHTRFAQGDVVNTLIKCAGGETILLTLNTTLPRFYSRDFTVCGTKGMYEEENDTVFLDKKYTMEEELFWNKFWGNAKEYEEEYDHPIWKKFLADGVQGGHGGMDWLVFEAFFDSIMNGKPCPIDVYDAASWMSITALSEESISLGGQAVAIPDFTNGAWTTSVDPAF
ncbi:MAG TPA: glycosyl hydrolase [Lachnospiraceae bacterium]|nr:glycosyl hydrolase [Lachnospiraceae bacterium]